MAYHVSKGKTKNSSFTNYRSGSLEYIVHVEDGRPSSTIR